MSFSRLCSLCSWLLSWDYWAVEDLTSFFFIWLIKLIKLTEDVSVKYWVKCIKLQKKIICMYLNILAYLQIYCILVCPELK